MSKIIEDAQIKIEQELNIILDSISEIRFRVKSTLENETINMMTQSSLAINDMETNSILVSLDQLEGQIYLKYKKRTSALEMYKKGK